MRGVVKSLSAAAQNSIWTPRLIANGVGRDSSREMDFCFVVASANRDRSFTGQGWLRIASDSFGRRLALLRHFNGVRFPELAQAKIIVDCGQLSRFGRLIPSRGFSALKFVAGAKGHTLSAPAAIWTWE